MLLKVIIAIGVIGGWGFLLFALLFWLMVIAISKEERTAPHE